MSGIHNGREEDIQLARIAAHGRQDARPLAEGASSGPAGPPQRGTPLTGQPTWPEIRFIPVSTDARKIRFFGTLMPALLLLKASPLGFLRARITERRVPRMSVAEFIVSGADDVGSSGDVLVFVHRWQSGSFDPLAFARARVFLAQLTRLLQRERYAVEPLDPLSPEINLPQLAAHAGLGGLSPYGLLVHPAFGPRLIITAVQTDYPGRSVPRWRGESCSACMACVRECPQRPVETGAIELGRCQSCAACLAVCPVGKVRPPAVHSG